MKQLLLIIALPVLLFCRLSAQSSNCDPAPEITDVEVHLTVDGYFVTFNLPLGDLPSPGSGGMNFYIWYVGGQNMSIGCGGNVIPCGMPYYFIIKTGDCEQILSGPSPCYAAPDCQSFDLPAPLGDSCHQAPYFSGGCLDGYCGSTIGLTSDQPGYNATFIPEFETNGWMRISPCKDSIAVDFQVFDCQAGNELGFFLLSGDCDTMSLVSFTSAKVDSVARLTASGLTPGEVYYLVVDGFYDAECKFQAHVVYGIGTGEPDTISCSNCTPSTISGPTDLCPGDIATYTFHPGGCDVSYTGGNGEYCPPPDICFLPSDTAVLHWVIPPSMNFIGDSVGVYTITVQVDTNLIGIDTIINGQVWAYWQSSGSGSSGGGGGGVIPDDVFCSCSYVSGSCAIAIIPLDVTIHHDVEYIYGQITCDQPCFDYNGQSYCSPGTYVVEQTNCLTVKLKISGNASPIHVVLPPVTLCEGECYSLGGEVHCPAISGVYTEILTSFAGCDSILTQSVIVKPKKETQLGVVGIISCAVPSIYFMGKSYNASGTYTEEPSNGCEIYHFQILSDQAPPTVQIAASQQSICAGEPVTLTASSNTPGVFFAWSPGGTGPQLNLSPATTTACSVVATNPVNGCTSSASTTIQVAPFVTTDHGIVGILNCINLSVSFMGNTYTAPGTYKLPFDTGCGEHIFSVYQDVALPNLEINPTQPVCAGESAVLSVVSAHPALQYDWNGAGTGPQITVSPTQTTQYTVVAYDPINGCTNFTAITQEVIANVSTYLPPVGICTGEGIYLGGTTFYPPGSGVYTSTLTSYTGCDSTLIQTVNVFPYIPMDHGIIGSLDCNTSSITFQGNTYTQPGFYSLLGSGTGPGGCIVNNFIITQDTAAPQVEIGPVQAICAGETVTLAATSDKSSTQFTWDTGQNGASITVTPSVTTTYTVQAINPGTACTAAASVTVTVDPATDTDLGMVGTLTCAQPSLTVLGQTYTAPGQYAVPKPGGCGKNLFTIAADQTTPAFSINPVPPICAGDSVTLTVAGPPDLQYVWNTGITALQITVAPAATTNYTVVTTNPLNGCSSTSFAIVTVNPLQTVQLGTVGSLTCAQPCVTYNGQEYCQPGTYTVTANCEIREFTIAEDASLPTVQLGTVGTLTCAQPCVTFNGQEYCQPGTYTVTANCEIREFTIAEDASLPTVQLGTVGTLTCAQPCVTFNGQEYCQPGTYTVTANCEIREFTIAEDASLPTVQLGTVGTLTCAQPCVTFNGQEYCQPGTFTVTANCEIREFTIAEDASLPTVQLGTVGTLTCAQPCVTFNGQEYCQPGTYTVTGNCEMLEFSITEDLSLPTVQLGTVATLTCAEPCVLFNGQEYCQPGTYTVTENCEIKTFSIDTLPPAWLELGEDKTIPAGEPVELQAETNAQPDAVNWYIATGPIPGHDLGVTVQPSENTLYSLQIEDVHGCLLADSVWVFVKKAAGGWYAPNIIRPGSGGANGWFTLFAGENTVATIGSLEIYDRWGNQVFARRDFPPNVPELGWDGSRNGKMLDPGVFVWHAVLLFEDGTTEKVKGDLTVYR